MNPYTADEKTDSGIVIIYEVGKFLVKLAAACLLSGLLWITGGGEE